MNQNFVLHVVVIQFSLPISVTLQRYVSRYTYVTLRVSVRLCHCGILMWPLFNDSQESYATSIKLFEISKVIFMFLGPCIITHCQ